MQPVAIITGATSGVGRAVVRQLAREGWRLGLIARGEDGLSGASREVADAGSKAMVFPLDVSDPDEVRKAADTIVARWGRLDAWINNAMVSVFAPTDQITPAEFRRVTEVNYLGYVHGTLAALHHMRRRKAGVIVQVGSALAYRSIPLQSAYCASKAAIRGFTDALRCELSHEGSAIRITMVQLPAVNTPQFDVVRNKLPKHPYPVPPVFQPELIARAIVRAIHHPHREHWVGWSTWKAILGERVIPARLDRYLGDMAWSGQQTSEVPRRRADNLDAPLSGDRGAHGAFDRDARARSPFIWASLHPRAISVAALALVAAGAGLWRRRSHH